MKPAYQPIPLLNLSLEDVKEVAMSMKSDQRTKLPLLAFFLAVLSWIPTFGLKTGHKSSYSQPSVFILSQNVHVPLTPTVQLFCTYLLQLLLKIPSDLTKLEGNSWDHWYADTTPPASLTLPCAFSYFLLTKPLLGMAKLPGSQNCSLL